MQNLGRQLHKETLHEKDSNSDLRVIKVQFEQFIHSKVLEPYNHNSYDLETRRDFKEENHEQVLHNGLKRLNEKELQTQTCKVQEVQASKANLGDKDCSRIVSDKGNDQGLENQSNTSGDESMETGDSNIIPDSPNMCDNNIQNDQNVVECNDERVALASLIANLKLDVDENKKIQKQLKKANTTLAQELKECKSILAETSRTLEESNIDYDKLDRKLNGTLRKLAQKDIDIKEGLKLKAYEISVVEEKHNEFIKKSLLTKSHYEGLVKEKTKESINPNHSYVSTQRPTYNGRPTFSNPRYLKQAQSDIPCLYAIPHDQSDHANRLIPDREETLILKRESRSKLTKDLWRERFMNYLEEQTDGEAMINSIQNGDKPLPVVAQVSLAGTAQTISLIQGLPNVIYSLIDSNNTAKDLWDALERQTKNLMDINIDALYNILKQNKGDVNGALGYKKKAVLVTSDPLALVAEKTKVSKQKEKVEV
nr:hypothetical protein [Tanacetum cinerariifolium]